MFISFGAAITCALLVGVFFALVLTIRKPLSEHLHLDEANLRVGRWVYTAMTPTLLLSGLLIDKWGDKQILFAGLVLSAVGFVLLGLCKTQRSVIVPLVMLGVAAGWVLIATILMLPGVFFTDPATALPGPVARAAGLVAANLGQGPLVQAPVLVGSRVLRPIYFTPTAALNFGFVFVAIGTLLTPLLINYLCRRKSFKQAMTVCGLLCVVPAAFVALTPGTTFPRDHPLAQFDPLFVDPRLWMAVAAMVLYLPLERSLATWADRYLTEMQYDADLIPRFLAGFWIAFVAARLGTALVVQPGFEMWLVFVLVVTAASTLGNLVGFYGSARGGRGFLVIGACFGPIFPTFLAVILVMFPQAPATVLGIVLGLGFLGNALFQPALVAFARSHTIQATVRIPMLAALLLAAPTLMLALIWWPGG